GCDGPEPEATAQRRHPSIAQDADDAVHRQHHADEPEADAEGAGVEWHHDIDQRIPEPDEAEDGCRAHDHAIEGAGGRSADERLSERESVARSWPCRPHLPPHRRVSEAEELEHVAGGDLEGLGLWHVREEPLSERASAPPVALDVADV